MARRYDMRKRRDAAADTRASIIAAAHRLLNEQDGTALTLQEVADAAGVSRATVYKSVGTRRDLLAAVFEDQGRLIAFDRVLAATTLEDPARAVTATVRESCRAWSVIPNAIRKTLALAVTDPEVGALVRQYESYRRDEMRTFARRLRRSGTIRKQAKLTYVAATLALVTSFQTFDQLQMEHGSTVAAKHLLRIVTAALGINLNEE